MIPKELYAEVKAREDEIIKAFYNFNIVELPAGYEGEVKEAYNNLLKSNITPSSNDIITYLRAKAKIMSLFRNAHQPFLKSYLEEHPEERVGGMILPEWVIAVQIILGILLTGAKLLKTLRELFGPKSDDKEIQELHNEIYNINDVQTLIIIKQEKTESKSKR